MPLSNGQRGSQRGSQEAAGAAVGLWLAAAFVLLSFPALGWLRVPSGHRWYVPKTPLDGTRPDLAAAWRFLRDAEDTVPPGASFTVLATDPGREMELFMMSYGLLPDRKPLPSSYFMSPRAFGASAQYALAFGCDPRGAVGRSLVARLPGGCVYRSQTVRP